MLRGPAYLLIGWVLIAVVGGLADVLSLSVMLPATSAVILTHAAFARGASLPLGLAVAIALGYLEDLHQGAPVGTLTLAHALTFLCLRWASGRFHLVIWPLRALASLVAVVLVDLATAGILVAMSDVLDVRREALVSALVGMRWHALATFLVAPPVWLLVDRLFTRVGLEDGPAHPSPITRPTRTPPLPRSSAGTLARRKGRP